MGNFGRALRLALRYRWNVAASVICALIVAVLWGGNIGAVYPLVEVVFQGESLSSWADRRIEQAEHAQKKFQQSISELEAQLAKADQREQASIKSEINLLKTRLGAEELALQQYRWLKPLIDRYLPHEPFQTLVVVIGMLLVGTIIKDTFLTFGTVLESRLAQLAMFDLRKQFYRRTLRMELGVFNQNGTSDLLSRFTHDLEQVGGGIQNLFGRLTREPLKMIACLVGAAWVCWRLLVLSLVVAPVAAFLIARLAKLLKRANRKGMEQMSSLYNVLAESLGGIKVVKAFTMERRERRRFHQVSKEWFRRQRRIAFYDAMVSPVTEVMGICTISLAILAGAYLVLNQETHLLGLKMSERPLSIGALLMFFGMLAGISDPWRKLSEVFGRLQRASAAADRVYQQLDREPAVADPLRPIALHRHTRELVFENVSFGYQADHLVIENINLRIPHGEAIAVVGPNGCGKSTLANLIPRFYDPVTGSVTLDGHDLRSVRMRDLRSQIGLVTQETLLFDDTVFNNIRYGAPHATREQVIEAAKQAHAHKFIESRLDNGYETQVGPHGGRLSGGQRQRIALARAILRDPAILILDEATSQIDLESEQLIHKVLEQFIRNRTTFIITHRLATLALADRVVVMHGGRIIDVGPHELLLKRCEFYARLHEIQLKESA